MSTNFTHAESAHLISATRAIKNAKFLARSAPQIRPILPLAGEAEGRIPLRLLDQIHTPEGRKEALAAEPDLAPLLANVSFPAISTTIVGPLFSGTLRFVRVEFTIEDQNNAVFAVSKADIATAIAYAA